MEADYDPTDRIKAFERALEWGNRIPLGIIYRNSRPVFEERFPMLQESALVRQCLDLSKLAGILKEFY
jgi:2-oxoglutarate ferredoxin oxidoreductase subunit beta